MSDCLFCKIAAGEIPADIVRQDEHCVAFRDINAQAPTHILVIPRRHVATTSDLVPEDSDVIARVVLMATEIAKSEGLDAGYRLVWNCNEDAGQTVFHIHLHLLGGRDFSWPPG
jgi:histidine triad (HIT) family protein